MRFSSKRVLAVASVTTLLSGVGVAAFAVDDSKEVRQADFIPALAAGDGEVDDRDLGHYEFLEEGLHIWTESNDGESKIAQYFAPRDGDELVPNSYEQDWYGDGPRTAAAAQVEPGKQIVFDLDADRRQREQLQRPRRRARLRRRVVDARWHDPRRLSVASPARRPVAARAPTASARCRSGRTSC